MQAAAVSKYAAQYKSAARWLTAVLVPVALTGCLTVQGVHFVNHHGDSDAGGYSVSMDTPIYLAMLADKGNVLGDLKRYSRPTITHRDGRTTIADDSNEASMEHFYDRFECEPSPGVPGWSDCSFSYRNTDLNFPAWSIDWTVVLHKEMVVLNSNHDRKVTRDGMQVLKWNFDGNRVNSFDISFKVRVPKA